jgi:hypothetical protein
VHYVGHYTISLRNAWPLQHKILRDLNICPNKKHGMMWWHLTSTLRLSSDCKRGQEIPSDEGNASDPSRIRCCESSALLTSVPATVDSRCPPRVTNLDRAGNVVGPACPIYCVGNTLFKNSVTARRRSGALVCRSIFGYNK